MNVLISWAAQADLERLKAFLEDNNPAAAQQAVAVLGAALQSLDAFPERGHPSAVPGVRELIVPFGGSAYILKYALLPATDEIVILRIWHGRERRPE